MELEPEQVFRVWHDSAPSYYLGEANFFSTQLDALSSTGVLALADMQLVEHQVRWPHLNQRVVRSLGSAHWQREQV